MQSLPRTSEPRIATLIGSILWVLAAFTAFLPITGCSAPQAADNTGNVDNTDKPRRVIPARPWTAEDGQETTGGDPDADDQALSPSEAAPFWRARTGGEIWSNPAVPESGPVIFGSDDRHIYALDSRDGTERWNVRVEGRVREAPALTRDLVLIVDQLGTIHALASHTGAQRWVQKLKPQATQAWAADDRHLVHGGPQHRLVARNPSSGAVQWTFGPNEVDAGVRAVNLDSRRVYLITESGHVRALGAADGSVRWLAELSLDTRSAPKPVGSDLLLVGNGFLWCLDARTGDEKWRALTHEFVSASPEIARSEQGPPQVLVAGGDTLFAFDLLGRELWRRQLDGPFRSGPRAFGDRVLVGSGEHLLSAYGLGDGQERWRFETDTFITGALSVYGHPIHGDRVLFGGVDGALYGVTLPPQAQTPQRVKKSPELRVGPTFFDGTPTIRWSRNLGPALAPPTVSGNQVLQLHRNSLSCLDLSTGKTLWTKNLKLHARSPNAQPVVSASDNLVLVAGQGNIHALALDNGAEQWQAPKTGAPTRLKPSSLAVTDRLFVGTSDGRAAAFELETGARLWMRPLGGIITGPPVADDQVVFFGTTAGKIFALDVETGRERWTAKTSAAVAAGPHLDTDTLYAGDAAGQVHAFEPAVGGSRWTTSLGAGFRLPPTTHFGAVYLCGDDGNLSSVDVLTGVEAWRLSIGHRCTGAPEVYDGIVYAGSQNSSLHAVNAVNGEELWRLYLSGPAIGSDIGIDREGHPLVVAVDRTGLVIAVQLP